MKKLSILLLGGIFLMTGCKKDKNGGCSLSQTSILGTYKLTALSIQAPGQTQSIDYFSQLEACEKDDLYTLKADKTFTQTEGALSCDPPSEPSTDTWSLSGDNLSIGDETGTVADFTCSSFKYKQVESTTGATLTAVFTRQ